MNTTTAPGGATEGDTVATGARVLPRSRNPIEAIDGDQLEAVCTLVADPDNSSRDLLSSALSEAGIGRVLIAASAVEAAEQLAATPAGDLVLVSLQFGPSTSGVIAAAKKGGWTRVIALAPAPDIGPVVDAIGAGAHGVLVGRRAHPTYVNVPTSIHELSAREVEVLRQVADGRSNKWIGDELSLSALTVKSHLARIGRKLGTGDRAHMVALALRAGVIS